MEDRSLWTLVLGACSGVGIEIARLLIEENRKVILSVRNLEQIEPLRRQLLSIKNHSKEVRFIAINFDNPLEDYTSLNFNHKIRIIYNCIGTGYTGVFVQQKREDLIKVLNSNIIGPTLLIHFLANHGPLQIINISSLAAEIPLPYMGLYSASKTYWLSIADSIRFEDGKLRVQNLICGPIKTNFIFKTNERAFINPSMRLLPNPPLVVANKALKLEKERQEIAYDSLRTAIIVFLLKYLPPRWRGLLLARLLIPRFL